MECPRGGGDRDRRELVLNRAAGADPLRRRRQRVRQCGDLPECSRALYGLDPPPGIHGPGRGPLLLLEASSRAGGDSQEERFLGVHRPLGGNDWLLLRLGDVALSLLTWEVNRGGF